MNAVDSDQDAIIIGGGFYGAAIAIYLAKQRGFKRIILIERESTLLSRASFNNQARVHNGYHYPRSFTTAYRSRINFPKFVADWSLAIKQDFTKLYAIARRNSKVTGKQFRRFYNEIGARVEVADTTLLTLFEPRLIEEVYLVEEFAFDSNQLAKWARSELEESKVVVRFECRAKKIFKQQQQGLNVLVENKSGGEELINSRYVFNCAYSGLNQLGGEFPGTQTGLKQEITEMALMQMPPELHGLGVTVMDGPFFSMMPFPARGAHTLSHVRYTPHQQWSDEFGLDPYQKLDSCHRITPVGRMVRDVGRYMLSGLLGV